MGVHRPIGPMPEGMGFGVSFSADPMRFAMLAVGIVVLMVARVFEYGCVLQEQDDGLV